MLLYFSVANFKSFRDEQILDLTASSLQPAFSWLEKATVPVGKEESALRVKALYGANASGKSNLIKALEAMLDIGLTSARRPGMIAWIGGFGFERNSGNSPSNFELEFVTAGRRYRYGFSVDRQKFLGEWLFDETVRKAKIFTRENQRVSIGRKYFDNIDSVTLLERGDNELFRSDSSFLSALSLFSVGDSIKEAISFLSGIKIISNPDSLEVEQTAFEMLADKNLGVKAVNLLKHAGIEFEKLMVMDKQGAEMQSLPPYVNALVQGSRGRFSLVATYKIDGGNDEHLAWLTEKGESQGTQKLLTLAPYIINAIQTGGILIIDEFEAKLHTRLSREIVSMFNSATGNPNNAQFIFSTHDTNLLDHRLLRRDQIDFVEKEADRSSIIYSLADVKGIRKDSDFERDYLGGSYGAVPEVTDFNIAILED